VLSLLLLTPDPLAAAADGRDLLELLARHTPGWLPDRWGHEEPLRHRWRDGAVDDFWSGSDVFWTGGADGGVGKLRGPRAAHSSLSLAAAPGALDGPPGQAAVAALLRDLARRFGGDYGHLHLLVEAEDAPLASLGARGAGQGRPYLFLTARELERWLPELYWAVVLGPPYVELVGAARLRSAPAAVVEELAPDRFYLQLTDRLADVRDRRDRFEAARAAVKAHLGADLFWQAARGAGGAYRAPRFARPGAQAPARR
jgi:hypothetical protein